MKTRQFVVCTRWLVEVKTTGVVRVYLDLLTRDKAAGALSLLAFCLVIVNSS